MTKLIKVFVLNDHKRYIINYIIEAAIPPNVDIFTTAYVIIETYFGSVCFISIRLENNLMI